MSACGAGRIVGLTVRPSIDALSCPDAERQANAWVVLLSSKVSEGPVSVGQSCAPGMAHNGLAERAGAQSVAYHVAACMQLYHASQGISTGISVIPTTVPLFLSPVCLAHIASACHLQAHMHIMHIRTQCVTHTSTFTFKTIKTTPCGHGAIAPTNYMHAHDMIK